MRPERSPQESHTPMQVSLTGTVGFTTSSSSSGRNTNSNQTITGPIQVVDQHGAWRVVTFTYDGQPLLYYPEGVQVTESGINLRVAFILSDAGASNALVGVYANSSYRSVTIDAVTLQTESGNSEQGQALFAHGDPTGLLGFARTASRPTRLTVTFRTASGSTIVLSSLLPGQSS
jgi:hypothetical protein